MAGLKALPEPIQLSRGKLIIECIIFSKGISNWTMDMTGIGGNQINPHM